MAWAAWPIGTVAISLLLSVSIAAIWSSFSSPT
jgi:hypothetical protein